MAAWHTTFLHFVSSAQWSCCDWNKALQNCGLSMFGKTCYSFCSIQYALVICWENIRCFNLHLPLGTCGKHINTQVFKTSCKAIVFLTTGTESCATKKGFSCVTQTIFFFTKPKYCSLPFLSGVNPCKFIQVNLSSQLRIVLVSAFVTAIKYEHTWLT